jgi:hypothetical protein
MHSLVRLCSIFVLLAAPLAPARAEVAEPEAGDPPPPHAAPASASPPAEEPEAGWSVTLEAWGGFERYDVLGLQHAVDNNGGRDLLHGTVKALGVSTLLRLGWLDLGLLYEGSVFRSKTDTAVFTPLAGVSLDLGRYLRFDLLGELGGHQIMGIGISNGVSTTDARTVWLPYIGFRPTASLRIRTGAVRTLLSLAAFARWDLVGRQIDVKVAGLTGQVDGYDVGGASYGVNVGAGIEL